MKEKIWNLANAITAVRGVVGIAIGIMLVSTGLKYWWLALALGVPAGLTDFVDGKVARHFNQITRFGKMLDPFADKLLVFPVIFYLIYAGKIPVDAFFAVVFARELFVSVLSVFYKLRLNAVIPPSFMARLRAWPLALAAGLALIPPMPVIVINIFMGITALFAVADIPLFLRSLRKANNQAVKDRCVG